MQRPIHPLRRIAGAASSFVPGLAPRSRRPRPRAPVRAAAAAAAVLAVAISIPAARADAPGITAVVTSPFYLAAEGDPRVGNLSTIFRFCDWPPDLVGILRAGSQPYDCAFAPDGTRAYVTLANDDAVAVIDFSAPLLPFISAIIPVGQTPLGIAVSPDGKTAVVCNENDDQTRLGADTISILSLTPNPPVEKHRLIVGRGLIGDPRDCTITADSRYALVAFGRYDASFALTIDLTAATPRELVAERIPIGAFPYGVGTDPDRTVAVITSAVDNNVTVIDISRRPFRARGRRVPVRRNPAGKPDVTRDGLAVVTSINDPGVTLVDTTPAQPVVKASLVLVGGPRGVTIIDDENVALIACLNAHQIARLDLNTRQFLQPVTGIMFPHRIGLHQGSCTAPDLSVRISVSPGEVVTGSKLTYTVYVTNHGPGAARHITLTVEFPAETEPALGTATHGGEIAVQGNHHTVTFATLPAGETATYTVPARLKCEVADGIVFCARARVRSADPADPRPANDTSEPACAKAVNPAPVLVAPLDLCVPCDPGREDARIDVGTVKVTDNCEDFTLRTFRSDGRPSLNDPYPIGTTVVRYTVTDHGGRHSSAIQLITVILRIPEAQ